VAQGTMIALKPFSQIPYKGFWANVNAD
jgi:hypothetical protein